MRPMCTNCHQPDPGDHIFGGLCSRCDIVEHGEPITLSPIARACTGCRPAQSLVDCADCPVRKRELAEVRR